MKKTLAAIGFLIIYVYGYSQLPEDALRHSWATPSGTARNQAIGGASVSLGGDITSLFYNPAGLGLYKTSEITFSPGLSFYGGKSDYRGTDGTKANNMTRFVIGTSGIVWGMPNPYKKWNNSAFSIGVNRTANFNSTIHYKGQNDYSSFTTESKNEFAKYSEGYPNLTDEQLINQAIGDPSLSYTTRMHLSTYLVDIDPNNGEIYSRPEDVIYLDNHPIFQENTITNKGGITEIAIGFASSNQDKLSIGGSIGVPIVNFRSHRVYQESNTVGPNDSVFNSMTYTEDYKSSGVGFNFKIGAIYKFSEAFRMGLVIHTPSLFALTDTYHSSTTSDIGTVYGKFTETTDNLNSLSSLPNSYKYDLQTPTRFMLSGTYMFGGGQENVKNQKGFITADIEYLNHRWSRFSSANEGYADDEAYFKGVNNTVKGYYRGAFNFKLGGEIKFEKYMVRAGFAYYGNPYKDKNDLKANLMNISGGLGYRNKGLFVDLAYVQTLTKDVNFPYHVSPPGSNTFATVMGSNGNAVLTFGIKF
ncbi:outer membrane protein transport protein [Chitinophagaceae bacterium 26-R-25]|nr:outer membrane protein transport protein [Chitinophagaceae bacterium 26-R-25]